MSGEQYHENRIQPHTFDRRSFLRASVGSGIVSTVGLTGSAAAQETSGGDAIWRFESPGQIASSPTIVGKTVYFGCLNKKIDDVDSDTEEIEWEYTDVSVIALDAETGDVKWEFTKSDNPIESSPNIINGYVYIGSDSGRLYAIDANTGEKEWSSDVGVKQSSPVVSDDIVYVSSIRDSTVYALNINTGDEIWQADFDGASVPSSSLNSPVIMNESVYIGTSSDTDSNLFYALDAKTGEIQWKSDDLGAKARHSATISDEIVYVATESESNKSSLHALDANTGSISWSSDVDGSITSTPTVYDDTVYVGTENSDNEGGGKLHALNSQTGSQQWTFETPNIGVTGSPTVVDGTVIFGESGVYAVDAEDGEKKWEFTNVDGSSNSSPTVVDGVVFIGTYGSNLWAIDAGADGSSQDTRVEHGVLGHHHEWAGESSQSLDPVVSYSEEDEGQNGSSNPASTVFRQFTGSESSQLLWALTGLGIVGGTYAGYKKLAGSQASVDESSNSDQDNQPDDVSLSSELSISAYDEIMLGDAIRESSEYQLQKGELDDHRFWVLTPPVGESETVSTATFESFNEKFDSWSGMDSHQHLLNVFATGSDPLPWAAVEQTDNSLLVDHIGTLSTGQSVEALEQICDALHHVRRYGTNYKNLTIESVLFTDGGAVKLRGVLDAFEDPDLWYNAPEEFDGESTERSTVYRIGVIAYELLTGTLPYEAYPEGNATEAIQAGDIIPPSDQRSDIPDSIESVLMMALSEGPQDRQETVLHLRDDFESVRTD